tara:strand:- start:2057 stop:3760 length:1704 start_codon:yes stop_codon:yes gene_type:complete
MGWIEWFIFFIAIQIIHSLSTWKLYKKAGFSATASIIPFYNSLVLMKIINRPWWWVILLFIPIVNLLIFPIVWIETVRSFGKNSTLDTIKVVFTLGLYIFLVNYDKKTKYVADRDLNPRGGFEEWFSSIIFAVILATIVHTYFIQPFIIPTGSLERTLLVGDFLFVSKYHYGARVPKTVISFPMVHDTIVGTGVRSYLNKPQLPYLRLPKFQKIKRNEIVTFNWPADTVRKFFVREKGVKKPIDKKSNYVKRCVGIPGDTLEILNGELRINGKKSVLPYRAKPLFKYVAYNSKGISSQKLNKLGLYDFQRKFKIENITQNSFDDIKPHILSLSDNSLDNFTIITNSKGIPTDKIRKNRLSVKEITERKKRLTITEEDYKLILNNGVVDSIIRDFKKSKSYNTAFFPNNITFDWNEDNYGPIVIPKKNQSININLINLPLYKKIIKDYEDNSVKIIDNKIFINNEETSNYKFKMDYYWMMGDNRYSSEDSRMWGFVPEDHIVGKPIFIWMSIDGINNGIKNWKIRWDRVFTTIHEDGEPKSYLIHFVVFCFILWICNKYLLDKLFKNG